MKKNPKKVKEAVNKLIDILTTEAKSKIKNTEEEDLINFHHTLGKYIRNEFGLWNKNIPLLKNCLRTQKSKYCEDYKTSQDLYVKSPIKYAVMHPDDASFVILKELWKKLKA